MPRWLVILGVVAACTLLVALLRYAIDLLGVVFLIILVGFSIRAVSDWLTEGESVSAWALAAVFAGLFGTVMVGLWLFGARDVTTGALARGMPRPVLAMADWLEAHGWGQRVLLGGGGGGAPSVPSTPGPSASEGSTGAASPRGDPATAPAGSRSSGGETASHERKASPHGRAGEAEAATTSGTSNRSPGRSPGSTDGGTSAPAEATSTPATEPPPATQPSVAASPIGTTTTLVSSHATSVVGVSVRFTATVTGDSGVPTGAVVFFDGDRAIGTAPVRGAGPSVTAVFTTLDLGIGDHQIAAAFLGTHGFVGSRSEPIVQTITRR